MQKIKNSIVEKMIQSKLTSNEIDFLLYISRFQDDSGTISGIYYKEVCEAMNISFQGFYNTKNSLIEKGFIISEKIYLIDHDITILNNSFHSEADIKEGYINTNHNIFFQESFYNLKAGSKLLAMELMKLSYMGKGEMKIGTKKFYDKYTKIFGVSKRVMRNYLMGLKEFFSIGIVDGLYYIRPKKIVYKQWGQATETQNYNNHIVEVICRRKCIKETGEKEKKDAATLINQYKSDAESLGKNIINVLYAAVEESIQILSTANKTVKKLKPKLIHMVLKDMLYTEKYAI